MKWLTTKRGRNLARRFEYAQIQIILRERDTISLPIPHPTPIFALTGDEETRRAMKAYRQVKLEAMCSEMVYTLPRELRDMIYGFLHSNHSTRINSQALTARCGSIYSDERKPKGEQLEISHPHCSWDKRVVGAQFLQEMVESWYMHVTIECFYLLKGSFFDYTKYSGWDLTLTPSSFVRHVVVKIDFRDVHKLRMLDNLDSLSHLQTGSSVHMMLSVPNDDRYLEDLGRGAFHLGRDAGEAEGDLKRVYFRHFLNDEKNVQNAIDMWRGLLRTLRHLQDSGMKPHVTITYMHARLALYRHGQGTTLSEDHCRSVIEAARQTLFESAVESAKFEAAMNEAARVEARVGRARIMAARAEIARVRAAREENVVQRRLPERLTGIVSAHDLALLLSRD